MTSRIIVFFTFFLAVVGALIFRAFYIQVLHHESFARLQKRQFTTVTTLTAHRGNILDRHNQELATSISVQSLYADPSLIEHPRSLAKKLSPILDLSEKTILEKLTMDKRFVWIKRQMDFKTAEMVKALDAKGLGLVPESKRFLPNSQLLSQVVGLVGREGQGLEGLELKYDRDLRGENKSVTSRRDARGRPLVVSGQIFESPPEGLDLVLTVDKEIQYELEYEIRKVVEEQDAASATGIVMDPLTGEVIAMGSYPSSSLRNRAIADLFEPGSTFKAVVAAAALKSGKLQPNSKFYCENGSWKIGKRTIHEAEGTHKFGWLTLTEILQVSSNIGSGKVAFEIGQEVFRKAISDFGFGQKTGIDLPGESSGLLSSGNWPPHLMANISFGHGVGVTALQIVNLYSTIANGGKLLKPFVVSKIVDQTGQIIEERKPQIVREVLTPAAASKLTMMLMSVTEDGGTGTLARVDGYPVAGKTGTAQKVDFQKGGYKKGHYVSSFVGFVPANNPQFSIYIVVDDPQKQYYGAQVAAPVFQRIASFALRKRGFMPIVLSENKIKLPAIISGANPNSDEASAMDSANVVPEDLNVVPNLTGLTVREVAGKLRQYPIQDVQLVGAGLATQQIPAAGQKISANTRIKVYFKP